MAKARRAARVRGRALPIGEIPLIDCEGTAHDCGVMLGCAWREALNLEAGKLTSKKPWWKDRRFRKPMSKYAPHLPDLFQGMAKAAGLDEDMISTRAPRASDAGCTSFALAPAATLDGAPISGQSKDVSYKRCLQFQVLRMKIAEGPSVLALTYQGWLFGHGFVKGGTSIFRNSLYVEGIGEGIPYDIWGLLALHCPAVEDVARLLKDHGVPSAFHCTVADEKGGVIGIENGKGGPAFLKPKRGIYAHANSVLSGARMRRYEKDGGSFCVDDSDKRTARINEQFQADRGRLTAQLAYRALMDHSNYPCSVCRHQSDTAWSGAIAIAEPTEGLLHVTRGAACQNWPTTYRL